MAAGSDRFKIKIISFALFWYKACKEVMRVWKKCRVKHLPQPTVSPYLHVFKTSFILKLHEYMEWRHVSKHDCVNVQCVSCTVKLPQQKPAPLNFDVKVYYYKHEIFVFAYYNSCNKAGFVQSGSCNICTEKAPFACFILSQGMQNFNEKIIDMRATCKHVYHER